MRSIEQLLALLGPLPFPGADMSRSQRLYLAALAFAVALAFVAFWGLAAGSTAGHLALENAISVPLLLLVSSAAALPVALIVFRLTVRDARAADLLLGYAAATFGASLVLALQVASLLQLAAVAPPVLPHRSLLGHGIDAIAHAPGPRP